MAGVESLRAPRNRNVWGLTSFDPSHPDLNWPTTEGLGFIVRELPLLETVKIGEDLEVVCNRPDTEDSWLYLRAGSRRMLNLNDCVFLHEREIEKIRHQVGEVDVLLSISGYAEKIGEPGENEKRRAESQKYVDLLVKEAEIFKPKYVVPFASYKFFSHEENFYNNDGSLSPRDVYDDVRSRVTCETLVFYPGDSWSYGDAHDSTSAVERYTKKL